MLKERLLMAAMIGSALTLALAPVAESPDSSSPTHPNGDAVITDDLGSVDNTYEGMTNHERMITPVGGEPLASLDHSDEVAIFTRDQLLVPTPTLHEVFRTPIPTPIV